jgi:4-carboxymuconolactone decarboxylase
MRQIARSGRTADLARRRERAIEACARIFNVPVKEMRAAMAACAGPMLAEDAFLAAGGPAWSDPALTDRGRNMVIVTALAAQGVAGDRLGSHIQLAQRNGLGCQALAAMMTLATSFTGQARG